MNKIVIHVSNNMDGRVIWNHQYSRSSRVPNQSHEAMIFHNYFLMENNDGAIAFIHNECFNHSRQTPKYIFIYVIT